jgi:hypothetical protein
MMHPRSVAEVESAVFAVLKDLAVPMHKMRQRNIPLLDLITGDDASFVFIPDVEKLLGVETTQGDWDEVHTVADAIGVFTRALARRSGM